MSAHSIGVAIALPQPYSGELQAIRERLGDPAAASVVPHVTLLPPTLVEHDALPGITNHLEAVAAVARPFHIHLRGSATFRPVSPVVFIPLVAGISDCERLEQQVRGGPLERSVRFPYHPHVTVAHDLPDEVLDRAYEDLADYEAAFTATAFALFDQDLRGAWRERRVFEFPATVREGMLRPARSR